MKTAKQFAKSPSDDEIVIAGISGKFPLSENMNQFRENLFNKVDMMTSGKRWDYPHPDMPKRIGKVSNIEKFDPGFFGIHRKEADIMEPMYRGLMEKVLEAIYDAGVNPKELEGTKTGVYIATSSSDCQGEMMKHDLPPRNYAFRGIVRCVLPNRISYSLKINGPACVVDTGCSSVFYALNEAYIDMKSGKIDAAIIGAAVLHLHPVTTLQFVKLGALSPDGASKSFDDRANGYARSETISAVFLQKLKHARRMYSTVVHCKVNSDGYKDSGITHPSSDEQKKLQTDFYKECGVNPTTIDYVEPHGTGTTVGDLQEIRSIVETFCTGRSTPLLLGAVKTNMGHAEAGAGLCQIAKAVIIMENGLIPPNLHFKTPRKEVAALRDGRIKVVTETMPFTEGSGLIAMNSLGMGGSNSHLLLKRNEKDRFIGENDAPRLVCVSGRVEEGVEAIFHQLCSPNVELVALLHELFKYNIDQHHYRGFIITTKTGVIFKSIKQNCATKPELYLTFGDAREEFTKHLTDLLELPLGRTVFQRIQQVLTDKIYDKIMEVSDISLILTTVTVQIIVFEILKACQIIPKTIIGVGYGKLVEEFAKGHLSLEETILAVYHVAANKKYLQEKVTGIKLSVDLKKSSNLLSGNMQNFLFTLLKAVGSLYEFGYNPQVQEIYPKINFPVSRGTPMISPLIRWNHEENWFVASYGNLQNNDDCCERIVTVDVNEKEWNFISGHVIDNDDRNLFPATGYLYIVWETFAFMKGKMIENTAVTFENVHFERATHVPKDRKVSFLVLISKGSGYFEIIESQTCVARGKITNQASLSNIVAPEIFDKSSLQERDIYKELRIRGYLYSGLFRSIRNCSSDFCYVDVEWHKNWIVFLDNVLQVKPLHLPRGLFVAVSISKIIIDPLYHLKFLEKQEKSIIPVHYYKEINLIQSGGIEVIGFNASAVGRKKTLDPVLEKYVFVPNENYLSLENSVRIDVQLILENSYKLRFRFAEIEEDGVKPLTPLILQAFADEPWVQAEAVTLQKGEKANTNDCHLIVGVNLLQNSQLLDDALKTLTKDGFVISREDSTNVTDNKFMDIVSVYRTPSETLVLLRKHHPLKEPTILSIGSLHWIKKLQELIKANKEVLILSQGDPISGIMGFVSCIRKEPKGELCKCLFIQDETAPDFDLNLEFYRRQLSKNLAVNVFKNGQWGTYRHLPLNTELVSIKSDAYVEVGSKGNFSSLQWVQAPFSNDKELIDVHYAAVNFKDVMTALGRLQLTTNSGFDEKDFSLGFEFSGKHAISGKRVMGVTLGGALSTRIKADEDTLITVPDNWSLEEAATVPVVYLTVLYALLEEGKIKRGQSFLIHSGAGGIGQAAINIASHYGLNIFTTVGTEQKKRFLLTNYSCLKKHHIGNSRSTDFEQMVMKQTKGRGVDIVLNSLAEDKLQASLRCLAKGGKFLEIGKFDLMNNNQLWCEFAKREASFHGVHLERIIRGDLQSKNSLFNLLRNAIKKGIVKPLPRVVYDTDKVEEAFKFMASGGNIGKVLVKIKNEGDVTKLKGLMSIERYYCDSTGCCIVTGGLGGFGLELIDWLIKRGARKFLIPSRSGVKTGYQTFRLRTWKAAGIKIKISQHSISTETGCKQLLDEANDLGPVTSIFQLAVDLSDALFEGQTEESFAKCLAPKAEAAKHFDTLSRTLCPHLKDFVVFSSLCCGRGNAAQTNYGLANSIMERICEERKKLGLPGLAIQWGIIGDVGLVAEMQSRDRQTPIQALGTMQQSIASCLQVLDRLLIEQDAAVVGSMVVAEKKITSGRVNNIIDAVANVIGVKDIRTVSINATLPELGMDSLIATEIKQVIEREFDIFLTMKDVRNLTFAKLREIMVHKSTTKCQAIEGVINPQG